MPGLLLAQQLPGQEEGVGQGGLAAGGEVRQVPLGHFDAAGEGQGHLGIAAPKDDEPHSLPLLVGVDQQRQDRRLGLHHALVRPHGARGVHHEQDVPPDALLPHLVAQVRLTDGQGQVAPLPQPLVGGRGPEGGVKGQIRNGGLDYAWGGRSARCGLRSGSGCGTPALF